MGVNRVHADERNNASQLAAALQRKESSAVHVKNKISKTFASSMIAASLTASFAPSFRELYRQQPAAVMVKSVETTNRPKTGAKEDHSAAKEKENWASETLNSIEKYEPVKEIMRKLGLAKNKTAQDEIILGIAALGVIGAEETLRRRYHPVKRRLLRHKYEDSDNSEMKKSGLDRKLTKAIENGSVNGVIEMIRKGADVNRHYGPVNFGYGIGSFTDKNYYTQRRFSSDFTPLMHASMPTVALALIEAGANPLATDKNGISAIEYVVTNMMPEKMMRESLSRNEAVKQMNEFIEVLNEIGMHAAAAVAYQKAESLINAAIETFGY